MKYEGLNEAQVKASREQNGSNKIPESEPTTFWQEFMRTFKDPMIKILLGIAALMIVMYILGETGIFETGVAIYEPLGTIIAILIVAIVSAKTGVASDTAYRNLRANQKKDTCKAYRDGLVQVVDVDDVVVGDKLILQAGDKIPADGILIDGDIRVDNSALNGEAEECKKFAVDAATDFPEEITGDVFVDKYSLFRAAVVFDGEGVLDVRRVGLKTMMGKMAEEMQGEDPDSPLKVKLAKLAKMISRFGYIGAVIITICYIIYFIVQAGGPAMYFAQDAGTIVKNFIEAVSLAVVIVVCAVPEGLPLMISLVLMQNTKKMLDHNVLVRKAIGIETAGSLNILFSDKTGTITKGHLEVVEFFNADGRTIELEKLGDYKKVQTMVDIAIGMNCGSMFDASHKVVGGNVTDQALMRFLGEDAYKVIKESNSYEVGQIQGFNSSNKFSQVEIKNLGKVFYKGAPERFLDKATKALNANGDVVELDLETINNKINGLAAKAMRVLAFGYSESDFTESSINNDVVIIGFVAIRDDVRAEAKEAIAEVQKAGIQVVMITGDRLETAAAIAKDAGLIKKETDIALTSAQLGKMTDDEIKDIVKDIRVIARALPTDKSRMVRICQEMNLVVGMTGDGVNDSPALKKADVGFAMGSGTEAAKEAGEIVVLDDNFKSIKDAVLYGRTIYNNILKFCKFQLVVNIAAVAVSAISPFLGIDEPLKVTHLLFVNLVMDGLGAIMLGNEPALEKYMNEKPRRRDESLISKKMAQQILIMGGWLTAMSFLFFELPCFRTLFGDSASGDINDMHKTAYFVLFIVAALFNGFNVRDEGFGIFKNLKLNPQFVKVWIMIVAIQALIVNAALIPVHPFDWIGEMFSCTPFGPLAWLVTLLMAFTMIPVDMIRKAVFRTWKQ